MKKNILNLILILCVSLAFGQTVSEDFVDGRIYVKVKPAFLKEVAGESPTNIPVSKLKPFAKLAAKYGLTRIHKPFYQAQDDANLQSILKFEFAKVTEVNAFIDELSTIPGVEYAEKVSLNKSTAVPNDPLFASSTGSTHLNQINAQNAWNVFNGNSNITVAIIDNAVMWTHADLVANTYTNMAEANGSTGVDDDNNGYIDDINGYDVADGDNNPVPTVLGQDHGTHCAGTAGATSNNSTGIAAIGWNIKIIPVKCSFNNSLGSVVDKGYEGIIYAVKAKARIISCSWSNTGFYSLSEQYVIDYAWTRGSIVICAASNGNQSGIIYPAGYNHSYCVAAVTSSDLKLGISNFGSWVDICAPGDNILSTIPYTPSNTPSYVSYSGTSMATPMVAGLAALILSRSPHMTNTDVINCISSTAVNIYALSGNAAYASGNQLGAGRIEAFLAMNCAATYSAIPPVANFYAFLPNTCPNTLIPFIDSSLYTPTSWSWSFQGGTPATSTSSNPSVQWASPGTYSVSLTVMNANGSNTKNKLSYITVAGPGPLTFSEGFQNTQFLPTGWTPNNIWNDYIYWERTTAAGGFGTSTASARFNNYDFNAPGERDEMRTPKFDFSNVAKARLRFDVAYARYNSNTSIFDSMEVKMSVNCGTTWTSIYNNGGTGLATSPDQTGVFIPTSTQWRRDTIDVSLTGAGQTNVMFSFINRGHFGQYLYLDNINLVYPTPTISANNAPTICVNQPYTFTNTSVGAASYTWAFAGGSPASSTATNPSVSYATPGTYTLALSGVNGTSSGSITKTITVISVPILNVTANPSGTICAGGQVTLSVSGAPGYTWTAGPTTNTFVVSPNATSIYTVSGGVSACVNTQTVSVPVGPSPFTVSINASVLSGCPGITAILTASGASTYSWGGGPSTNTFSVSPNVTTSYTLTGQSGTCKSFAVSTVTIFPTPVSIISATPASCGSLCDGIVDASTTGGSGFTYSMTGSSCSVLPCSNLCPGLYTVVTTNGNSCTSTNPFTITAPTSPQAIITSTDASCATCNDGSIIVMLSGGTGPFTYTWVPIASNVPVISGLGVGCYTLIIRDGGGCFTYTTVCISFGTGLGSNTSISDLKLYPNPAHQSVNIEYEGQSFDYLIYNALGEFILQSKDNRDKAIVALDHFASGVYFVEIKTGQMTVRKKLIVE